MTEHEWLRKPGPPSGEGGAERWLPPVAPGTEPDEPPAPAWGPPRRHPGWAPPSEAGSRWGPPAGAAEPSRGPWTATETAATGALQLAGFGPRAGAAAIDFLIRLAAVAVGAGLGAILFAAGEDAGIVGLITGGAIGYVLGTLVYAPVMLTRTNGQTVGHRAAGTRIVMADGSRLTGGKAFLREVVVKLLLMEGIGGFLLYVLTLVNYLMPLWDDGNEALHDKICGTRVVLD